MRVSMFYTEHSNVKCLQHKCLQAVTVDHISPLKALHMLGSKKHVVQFCKQQEGNAGRDLRLVGLILNFAAIKINFRQHTQTIIVFSTAIHCFYIFFSSSQHFAHTS